MAERHALAERSLELLCLDVREAVREKDADRLRRLLGELRRRWNVEAGDDALAERALKIAAAIMCRS